MATNVLIYNLLLACTCVYAAARGGAPERLAAFGWAVACLATLAVPFDPDRSFHSMHLMITAIDVAALLWFVVIAAVANRFWPIWLAALHLLTIAVHGVKAYDPELLPSIYAAVIGKLAYPVLGIMAAGVYRHRERLRRFGPYRDWSFVRAAA